MGLRPEKLEIMPIGFAVSFKVDTKNYNKKVLKSNLLTLKKIAISFAGPMVNLLFMAIFFKLIPNQILFYINFIIFLFNMMPIYPLDGGRIAKYILFMLKGKKAGFIISHYISNFMAVVFGITILILSIALKNISLIFILVYLLIVEIKENKKYKIKSNLYKILENNIAINQD